MKKYYKNYKQNMSINFIGKRKRKCKHLWVEWESGLILKEPYCLNCGEKMPKEKWNKLTKMVNDIEDSAGLSAGTFSYPKRSDN